jgi:hypothetical protein
MKRIHCGVVSRSMRTTLLNSLLCAVSTYIVPWSTNHVSVWLVSDHVSGSTTSYQPQYNQYPSVHHGSVQPVFACLIKENRLISWRPSSRPQFLRCPGALQTMECAHFRFQPKLFIFNMHNQSPSWFILRSKATADIRSETLVPTVIFTALASLLVALRWCSRVCCRSTAVQPEDYFVTAAMVGTSAHSSTVFNHRRCFLSASQR